MDTSCDCNNSAVPLIHSMEVETTLIFVYGTLIQDGESCNKYVGWRFVENDIVAGTMYNLGWFPGVKLGGENFVHGVVYEIPESDLDSLDRYEGVPGLYVRERITTLNGNRVWIYEYNQQVDPQAVIKEGKWDV